MEAVKCLDGASYYSKDNPYRLFGANLLHDGIWIYSTPQGRTMADLSTHPDVSEATREESRLRFAESRRKRLEIEDAGKLWINAGRNPGELPD